MDDGPRINIAQIANELKLKPDQVEAVMSLLDQGNTVPFITRYRKEATDDLDEEQIRSVQKCVESRRQFCQRASAILRLVDAQGKLTAKLRKAILAADSLKHLEDLYLPYRQKRRSRAAMARERGLEPLAIRIRSEDQSIQDLDRAAAEFIDAAKDLPDAEAVLQGASDILAESIGDDAAVRARARKLARATGKIRVCATTKGKQNGGEFRDYFEYEEQATRIPAHRTLAINRGEASGALRVRFEWDDERVLNTMSDHLGIAKHRFHDFMWNCMTDTVNRLIRPAMEREVRRELTDNSEAHAVGVFVRNLRSLLMQSPLRGERIVAIDPGLRTGCKLAALDECGRFLDADLIFVTGSEERRTTARQKLAEFMRKHDCQVVAIGNGTACRETEELVAGLIEEDFSEARYVIVNEAGASVYSASTVARDEFPDFDATVRGTISIGRRLQDPLSELVKIEPRHLGIGMYQHDLNPKRLQESLDQVIESCVNSVGVDLNNASASLLKHVSGLNQLSAKRVVAWRHENGRFRSRRELLKVAGVGETTFTQAAGFLRIAGGDEPLDATWIHPESYDAARKILERLSLSPADLIGESSERHVIREELANLDPVPLAPELGVGVPTIRDIADALLRPGRDPRADVPGPVFKRGILRLDDLASGMELTGTVLNVVDFGAFVDVGLKDSGLVHISRMSTSYVNCPHDVVAVGDVVTVWVLGVDKERQRVSLTMVRTGTDPDAGPDKTAERQSRSAKPHRRDASSEVSPKGTRTQDNRSKKPSKPSTSSGVPDADSRGNEPLRGFDELKAAWKKRERD